MEEEEFPDRPECDFSVEKPLEQRFREAEAEQLELFPEDEEEKYKQFIRRIKRLIDL